jgi:hypothetical protein
MSVRDRMGRSSTSETHESGALRDFPTPTPSYLGCLQGIGNGNVLGWCADPEVPERQVPIAIAVDGEIVAQGTADIARPDLTKVDEGARGFLIALPESLQSPGRHRVLALAGSERVPLEAAPSFWLDAGSGGGWSDVVFEPEDQPSGYLAPSKVPAPPIEADRQATVSGGWLLDARESRPAGDLSRTELDRLLDTLANVARTCSNLDVLYIPAIVPAKRQAVGLAPTGERESILTLRARLRDINDVELIDLLPVLRDASGHGACFHRTDADWNDRGAFFVVRALLKEAHKRIPALTAPPLANLHLRTVGDYRGTLADVPKLEAVGGDLLPVDVDVEDEQGVVVDAHALHALRMPVESHLSETGEVHLRVYVCPDRVEDTRVAVVGDSAALALVTWLAEQARRTTFFWTRALPLAQLELEMPQVVFHLIREADLLAGGAPFATEPDALGNMLNQPVRELRALQGPTDSQPSAAGTPSSAQTATPAIDAELADVPHLTPPAEPVGASSSAASAEPATLPAPSTPNPPILAPYDPHGNGSAPAAPGEPETVVHADLPRWLDRWGPVLLLGVGMLGCGLLLMLISRHMSFFADDWEFILKRRGWNPGVFLEPYNGHLSLVPVAIYKILFVTVGLSHHWPYIFVVVVAHLVCVALVYRLASRRAGRWVALIPCGLLLLPGAAYEDVLWTASIGFITSVAAGVGALLCLERRDRHGDIAAMLLLCVSLASTSVGVAVTAGVLVMLASSPSRRPRVWVTIVPLVLYGLWYLHYGSHESQVVWANLPKLPGYDTQIGAYGFAAFGNLSLVYGEILLVAGVSWVISQIWRGRALAPHAQVGIVGALVFWSLVAMTRAQLGEQGASRYIYPSMVFLLLCLIPYLRQVRVPSARAGALLAAGIVLILLSGIQPVVNYAHYRSGYDTEYNARLGAELIADRTSDPYIQATNELGSQALSARQIMERPESTRLAADGVILQIEHFPLLAPTSADLATATAPEISWHRGVTVGEAPVKGVPDKCARLTPVEPGGFGTALVAPGHTLYLELNGTGSVEISARRLARKFPNTPLHRLISAGSPAVIPFQPDRSSVPWHVRLTPTVPTTVCIGPPRAS